MKQLTIATLFAVSTFVLPAVVVTTPAQALTCGVDAPAEWERPGGFCDALKSTQSLATPVTGAPPAEVECVSFLHMLRGLEIGGRILVAENPCLKPD
ncbi:hypothetical protein [Devosia sp.]|jgi:hypothetical protein|uniref:hypothetical protein n=1 Tax=Devosia sp. TaxID=1871048 RepID=UPI0037C13484